MRQMDAASSGFSAETLMERAGTSVATEVALFIAHHNLAKKVFVLAGKGNNGGDAYTAARELIKRGFEVVVYEVMKPDADSLCHKKKSEYEKAHGTFTTHFPHESEGTI